MTFDATDQTDRMADSMGLLKGSKQIAEFIGISQRDVLNLVHKGDLPAFVIGNSLRARPESLRQWVEDREMLARMRRASA